MADLKVIRVDLRQAKYLRENIRMEFAFLIKICYMLQWLPNNQVQCENITVSADAIGGNLNRPNFNFCGVKYISNCGQKFCFVCV